MKKRYLIITYGCQMNYSDSERLAAVLEKSDYQKTTEIKKANLVVIVACSVRQMAIDRVYGKISQILKFKAKNKKLKLKILLTGCLTVEDKKKLKEKVDFILNIKELPNLPQILSQIKINSKNKKVKKLNSKNKNYLDLSPKYSTFPIAYIPIMTGCNNYCTYCVVPYTRQKEVSRSSQKIIQEIKGLIKKKYKMIVLLGQNVNSYKSNLNFPDLLKKIAQLKGNFWLTFITSHPKDLSTGLINIIAKEKKIMPYLHLPVQSGDNEILKKMNRHYTITHYKKIINQARKKIKDLSVSTDVIVGFCGETKKQFNNTKKLMRWIEYDMAYPAKYSPRPNTLAEKFKDNISAQEKTKRWCILTDILRKTALKKNKKYLNKKIDVLIENQKNNYLFGQSKNFKNVRVIENKKTENLIGQFVKIKITKTIAWGLEGIIV